MPKVKMFKLAGGEGKVEMADQLTEGPVHQDLLFRASQSYLVNQRQGTHATKTRAQVVGSGRKPWPQKHTGNARHGSFQSPIWVGGGITFGPQPKEYRYKLPQKMRKQALASAIRDRYQSDRLVLIDRLEFEKPKTKEAIRILEQLSIPQEETLLVIVSKEENDYRVRRSFSNLPGVTCAPAIGVHAYEVLKHQRLLVTSGALEELTVRVD
ncbi:MAG: 50S ribosomal protein L4 [Candidatus Fraserbacteria bacterium RBG_16_55_9]|uniref:Large ribosomal subunit protein uL4 n=1 Tax=Fraserbacteria sp. (strain RBG_16_55_9) TaxID=1817864 RepID=A0A1F5UPA9_FRAXR|nr:ribosomal protein L4 [uncultured bacterium]OGF52993.1 MAG: 50S ribosomal protein L4 [Candidatus Fraserbacteria bacterium RBG_16_55_9]